METPSGFSMFTSKTPPDIADALARPNGGKA